MAQAQTTHAATEAHGGSHEVSAFPPFETETFAGQLLWLAITFVAALRSCISRLVLPRLGGIIENRRETIARDLDDAAAMKIKAEDAGAAYEKALAEARGARAGPRSGDPRPGSPPKPDASRKVLELDLSARLAEAEATIARRKPSAMTNVREHRGRRRDRDRRADHRQGAVPAGHRGGPRFLEGLGGRRCCKVRNSGSASPS